MQTNGTKPKTPTPPDAIATSTLLEMQAALKRPLPKSMLSSKTLKNKKTGKEVQVDFINWYTAIEVLDKYCPGWRWEIKQMICSSDRLFIVGRLTIPTADGEISREATGTEYLNCGSYGDPSSNAESMAFRRCAAKFGLGLYMYK